MDTGRGNFEELKLPDGADIQQAMRELEAKHPQHGGWFRVGEEVEIRGSRFRVKNVKPGELRLKLLPKTKAT